MREWVWWESGCGGRVGVVERVGVVGEWVWGESGCGGRVGVGGGGVGERGTLSLNN